MNGTALHPAEEALCEFALDDGNDDVLEHIGQCSECREYVEDIRAVSADIAAIHDEEVPERLEAAILAIARCKEKCRITTILETWYKNPFLIGILTAALVLLLYAVFITV